MMSQRVYHLRGLMAGAALLTLGALAAPVAAQEITPEPMPMPQSMVTGSEHTIAAVGVGTASGSPDVAVLDIGVEVFNPEISPAVSTVNERIDAVTAALVAAGIPAEDIRTVSFNIYQERAFPVEGISQAEAGAEQEGTFVVSHLLQVRVRSIDRVSAIIQTALDAGANRMYGLSFGLEDAAALLSEARAAAVADARSRAEELAGLFGVTLGPIVRVSERIDGGGFSGAESMRFAGGGAGPSISTGQLSVSVTVEATFAIAGR